MTSAGPVVVQTLVAKEHETSVASAVSEVLGLATGDRRPATGDRRPATGDRTMS